VKVAEDNDNDNNNRVRVSTEWIGLLFSPVGQWAGSLVDSRISVSSAVGKKVDLLCDLASRGGAVRIAVVYRVSYEYMHVQITKWK
jgi:hypothetical protein